MRKGSGMFWDVKNKQKKIKGKEPTDLFCAAVKDEAAQNNIQLQRQTQRLWLVITVIPG